MPVSSAWSCQNRLAGWELVWRGRGWPANHAVHSAWAGLAQADANALSDDCGTMNTCPDGVIVWSEMIHAPGRLLSATMTSPEGSTWSRVRSGVTGATWVTGVARWGSTNAGSAYRSPANSASVIAMAGMILRASTPASTPMVNVKAANPMGTRPRAAKTCGENRPSWAWPTRKPAGRVNRRRPPRDQHAGQRGDRHGRQADE